MKTNRERSVMRKVFKLINEKTKTITTFHPRPDGKLVFVDQVHDDHLGVQSDMPVAEARELWMRMIRTGAVQCK